MMTAAALHALPVHSGLVFAEDLKPVKTQVAPPGTRMLSQYHSKSYETSGIARPALQDRQPRQIRRFDNFLADCGADIDGAHRQRALENPTRIPNSAERRRIDSLDCSKQLLADLRRIAAQ